MFERDYLVRMLVDLAAAIRRAMDKAKGQKDLEGAAATLENSISNATDLDGSVLLTLSPDSIAQVLQVSNTDPRVVIYIAHSMQLQSHYLEQLGKSELSKLRKDQAKALASAYNIDLLEDVDRTDQEMFDEDAFMKSLDEMCSD